ALIRSSEPLPDGRANILAVGERRFVLRRWVTGPQPYRVAEVEEFDDEPVDAAELATLAQDVREGFARLARALGVLTERSDEEIELPSDAALLSFQVAAALELDLDAKRALQAGRNTSVRLRPRAAVLGTRAAVVAVVRLLAALGVPFVPRGAGTGLSGGALADDDAVLVVLTRLNRILKIDPQNRLAVVEPGVVNARLSAAVAPHGLQY